MIASQIRKLFLTGVALITAVALSAPGFGADKSSGSQKTDAEATKQKVIESRKEQQQKRGELRDAVKSGASKEEIEPLQKQVKEGQKAIVQEKKQIREKKLGDSTQSPASKETK